MPSRPPLHRNLPRHPLPQALLAAVALLMLSQNSQVHAGGKFSKTGNDRERAAAPPPSNQSTAPRSSSSAAAATDPARGIGDPTQEEIDAAQRQRGPSEGEDAPAITRVFGTRTQTISQYDRVPRAAPAPSGNYGAIPQPVGEPPVPVAGNVYMTLNHLVDRAQGANIYEQVGDPLKRPDSEYDTPIFKQTDSSQNASGEHQDPDAPTDNSKPQEKAPNPDEPAT